MKINLFFHSFSLNYFVNTLFFNDETMHKIYEDEGIFDFIYFIPQIIYSAIISSIINVFLRYLSLTEKNIIELKKSKNLQEYNDKCSKTIKSFKIKFIIFYIISFLILGMIWYYISCFCVVYKNTQIYLIKDTLISFGLSFIYPFFVCLLPGIIRIASLNNPGKYLYRFSMILQFFFD